MPDTVKQDRLLKAYEDKMTEVINLKIELGKVRQELENTRKQHQNGLSTEVRANEAQINALAIGAEAQAQQMRSLQELQ